MNLLKNTNDIRNKISDIEFEQQVQIPIAHIPEYKNEYIVQRC